MKEVVVPMFVLQDKVWDRLGIAEVGTDPLSEIMVYLRDFRTK